MSIKGRATKLSIFLILIIVALTLCFFVARATHLDFFIHENRYNNLCKRAKLVRFNTICIRTDDVFIFDESGRRYLKMKHLTEGQDRIVDELGQLGMSCIDKVNKAIIVYDYGFLDGYYGYVYSEGGNKESVERLVIRDQDIRFGGVLVRQLKENWFYVAFNA